MYLQHFMTAQDDWRKPFSHGSRTEPSQPSLSNRSRSFAPSFTRLPPRTLIAAASRAATPAAPRRRPDPLLRV